MLELNMDADVFLRLIDEAKDLLLSCEDKNARQAYDILSEFESRVVFPVERCFICGDKPSMVHPKNTWHYFCQNPKHFYIFGQSCGTHFKAILSWNELTHQSRKLAKENFNDD